ncbi:hypothetical protein [Azonexus hydrophilus]
MTISISLPMPLPALMRQMKNRGSPANGDVAAQRRGVWFGSPAITRFIRDTGNNYVSISTFGAGEDGQARRRLDWSGMWLALLDDMGHQDRRENSTTPAAFLVETSPGTFGLVILERTPA